MTSARERRDSRDRFEARLASRLSADGLLSEEDLEEAIRQQVIMGGHLATNLWELGFVDGRKLSVLSAQLLRIPEANPHELAAIPTKVLALLPRDFVERNRILPLGIKRRTLRVATSEPWNHLSLGEAAFLSGYPVEPCFVAEVPLMRLLEQYYAIPLRARFRLPLPAVASEKQRAAPPAEIEPEKIPWDDLPELPDDIATVVTVGSAAVIQPFQEPSPPEEEPVYEPIKKLPDAQAELAEAHDRDAIGRVLVRFALSRGTRVVLLIHRRGRWSGWLAAGEGVNSSTIRDLIVPTEHGTMFGLVSETGAHYMGPIKAHPVHQTFLETLGDDVPGAVAFFPVHLGGKLVFGIYLDAGDGADVPTDVAEILVLAQRVSAVLARLIEERLAQAP